jgi:DNA polymerase-3 subunit beta
MQTVIGVVENKPTLPILSHVLIQLKDSELTLTTTDMEIELHPVIVLSDIKHHPVIVLSYIKHQPVIVLSDVKHHPVIVLT